MDIKMPVLDGYSAAKMIKEMCPEMKIVAQTAYALEHELERYKGIFDDYVIKPIEESVFKEIIKKYLDT
jgi:CheY-like chemotaxis protein